MYIKPRAKTYERVREYLPVAFFGFAQVDRHVPENFKLKTLTNCSFLKENTSRNRCKGIKKIT